MTHPPIPSIYDQSLTFNRFLSDDHVLWILESGIRSKGSGFSLFFRKTPFKGGFTVAAGLESVISFLEKFKFDSSISII